MASFTVLTGATDTVAKTVGANDVGVVEAGGTLQAATAVVWTGGSSSPGVTLDNFGSILGGTRAIDSSISSAAVTVNNNHGAVLSATGNDGWRINSAFGTGSAILNNAGLVLSAGGQAIDFEAVTSVQAHIEIHNLEGGLIRSTSSDAVRPGAGDVLIDNDGTILSTAARGVNLNTSSLANIHSFQLVNGENGVVEGLTDAVRVTAGALAPMAAGTVKIENYGLIRSVGLGDDDGQALDLNDVDGAQILNGATGVLSAADADGIRPGENAVVTNFGRIVAFNGLPDSDGNDAIDFQEHGGGAVDNREGGEIVGPRHGITGDEALTIDNAGLVQGQLGSGINLDTGPSSTTTVVNAATGVIEGFAAGAADGDAIDVDGLLVLTNSGLVEASGASSESLTEAVAIGGGSVTNLAGGVIRSTDRAITVDDSDLGSAFGAVTIENAGLIQGGSAGAISIAGDFADAIVNRGRIVGAVSTGGGDDAFTLYTGSSIDGAVDAGGGIDTVELKGAGEGAAGALSGVEAVNVLEGAWTLGGEGFAVTLSAGAGPLTLARAVISDGLFSGEIAGFDVGDTLVLDGAGHVAGAVIGAGALLTVSGGAFGGVALQLDADESFAGLSVRVRIEGDDAVLTLGKDIDGGNGGDILVGGAGDDRLDGGNGVDDLTGGAGADTLVGGNGVDLLQGGVGDDLLQGDNGGDSLVGGAGADTLVGGQGPDVFGFGADFGQDAIADFAKGDRIRFEDVFSDFASVKAAAHQDGADVVIALDADDVLRLKGVTLGSLGASDFLFA